MKVNIGNYPRQRPWDNILYDMFGYEAEQKVKVRIDPWDTWSMDNTLAYIILPMLKQLKETKHGYPNVDNEDVPVELRVTSSIYSPQYELFDITEFKELYHNMVDKKWDWVLDEMIWTFEQIVQDDESEFWGEWVADKTKILGGYHYSIDFEGLKSYRERIDNGTRLFGKYYRGLWD